MPIFISYSHKNKEFVDKLAIQLVARNVNIWIDRWELSLGDSLIDKVQEAADGASALLVILSKESISSEWCKKELNSGLSRELEEKRVVVMPVLLEDCDIPIFVREKLHADFRSNFDDGLRTIIEGIAKITNPYLARAKEPKYHLDWSIDYGDVNGDFALILNYVAQAENQPYTCLTNITIICSPIATKKYQEESHQKSEGEARKNIIKIVHEYFSERPNIRSLLVDEREKVEEFIINGKRDDEIYHLRVGARRLGEDTGRDVLVNTSNLISQTYRHMTEVLIQPN